MTASFYVSADSHVLEPGDLWVKEASQADKERVPRVITKNGQSDVVGEGLAPRPLSMTFAAGLRGEKMDYNNTAWENRPAAGYDLKARLESQDIDGVAGEVLYPTLGLNIFNFADPVLRRECFRVYNRWVGDMARRSNGRLLAVAMLPVDDLSNIEKDIREALDLGCFAVQPPSIAEIPYNQNFYEPLWATAEAMGVPVLFHIGAGGKLIKATGPGAAMMNYLGVVEAVQTLCHTLIWAGVFMRHPNLQVGIVEAGIGWIAPLLDKMDDVWEQHRSWIKPTLEHSPSYYFRKNCHATFERDPLGLQLRHHIGLENIMWATDYPHAESSWPDSRAISEKYFKDIPEAESSLICWENVLRLYKWSLPSAPKMKAAA